MEETIREYHIKILKNFFFAMSRAKRKQDRPVEGAIYYNAASWLEQLYYYPEDLRTDLIDTLAENGLTPEYLEDPYLD